MRADDVVLAAWITRGEPPDGVAALAPGRFGALTDEQLIKNGTWQYAHYYDPVAPDHSPRVPPGWTSCGRP